MEEIDTRLKQMHALGVSEHKGGILFFWVGRYTERNWVRCWAKSVGPMGVAEIVYSWSLSPPSVRDAGLPQKTSEIMIGVASCHGLSLETWEKPITWTETNIH